MVSIQRGLLPELVSSAADLFVTALYEKLIPVLGNQAKAIAFIKSSIVPNSCFSAVEDGRLLGVLAIQTNEQGFLNIALKNLRDHYGLLGGIRRGLGLILLQHIPKPAEIYIDGIVVADFARGKGIGTKLIDELMIMGGSQGFERVTLHVIDTNPRALGLYERLGFTIQKCSNLWPANRIMGWTFSKWTLMARDLG